MRVRPYLFYDTAISICSTCFRRVDAKIVFEDDRVLMMKRCPDHGTQRVLVADDVDYYRRCREVFIKPPEMPLHYNTPVKWGCPYDCGLCADHEQHSCLSLVEIADACNLRCPICYASSGPDRPAQGRPVNGHQSQGRGPRPPAEHRRPGSATAPRPARAVEPADGHAR